MDTVGVGEWGTLTHKSFALSVAQLGHKGEPIVNQRCELGVGMLNMHAFVRVDEYFQQCLDYHRPKCFYLPPWPVGLEVSL